MSWRRFGEAARSGTRRSRGAASGATLRARSPAWAERQPAPRPMELLLCLNRLAVSIIFFFVSSLPPPYWATKKKGRGGLVLSGCFSPPHPLSPLTRSSGTRAAARFGEGLRSRDPRARPSLHWDCSPPPLASSPSLPRPPVHLITEPRAARPGRPCALSPRPARS